MSRLPFVITLVVSGSLVGWLYLTQDAQEKEKSGPGGASPKSRIYGYPEDRGLLLQVFRRPANPCAASTFRSESPEFALWDDGTVVFRNSTFDYKRGRVSPEKAQTWMRTAVRWSDLKLVVACGTGGKDPTEVEEIRFLGRGGTLRVRGLSQVRSSHVETCPECLPLRPLARMLEEIDHRRFQGRHLDATLTELPVEVHLEFRSCGCRNHPEIVSVSKEWPIAGPRPSDRCGRNSARFRMDDPEEIRALAQAIERSAAVLDGEEIYTCFMRPLLSPRKTGDLARR